MEESDEEEETTPAPPAAPAPPKDAPMPPPLPPQPGEVQIRKDYDPKCKFDGVVSSHIISDLPTRKVFEKNL